MLCCSIVSSAGAWSPECGLETFAPMSPFPNCRVEVVPSATVAQVRGFKRMHGCTGNGHFPGATQDAREVGVSPGEMKCAEDSDYIRPDSVVESPVYVLVSDWVTSLRISPQTCTGLTATTFASSGSDVDCAGWVLALLSFSVVEYHVIRNKVACGGPGGGRPCCYNPAAGYVFGTRIGLEV